MTNKSAKPREEQTYNQWLLSLQTAFPKARFFLNARKFQDSNGVWRNISLIEGSADIIGCVAGRYVEIEVKMRAGRQSERQKAHQRAIEQAGGIYMVAKDSHDTVKALQERLV